MSEDLTDEEFDEIREAFYAIDKNNEGCITVRKLATALRSLGQNPTEEEVQNMINEVDSNGNGTIEFDEFLNIMIKKKKDTEAEETLKQAFKAFDKDQNGYISAADARLMMIDLGEKITDDEAEEMIKDGDLDGDGQLSYDEFVKIMSRP